jgi:hypothetical protein
MVEPEGEKGVIEQQSLVDDELMRRIKVSVQYGFQFKNGEVKLLIDEIERLRLELIDFEMLCDHTSQIYDWASNGRISKPTTLPSEVILQGEAWINDLVEEAVIERTKPVRELLPVLKDMVTSPMMMWGRALTSFICKQVDDAIDQLPKQVIKKTVTQSVDDFAQSQEQYLRDNRNA